MTARQYNRYSRRNFLQGLGVGLGFLPLLDSRPGLGDSAVGFPRRLITVVCSNGTIDYEFYPYSPGTRPTTQVIRVGLKQGKAIFVENPIPGTETDLAKLELGMITKPLEPYKQDLIFFDNNMHFRHLDTSQSFGHGTYASAFAGKMGPDIHGSGGFFQQNAAATFDQVISEALVKRGWKTQIPKLHLGTQLRGHGSYGQAFFSAPGRPSPVVDSPATAAAQVFGTQAGDPDFERLRAERKSMLDFIKDDIGRFQRRVSRTDKQRIDAHLASIRSIEEQLTTIKKIECAVAKSDGYVRSDDEFNPGTLREVMDAHFDVAVAALACGVTRIVTVQLHTDNCAYHVYPWLGLDRTLHDIAHNPWGSIAGDEGYPAPEDKIRVDNWLMQQFAKLIDRMKNVKENGTLLDNSAILWGNHMGEGSSHYSSPLPWVIAGKCGGGLRTGQYVRLPERSSTHGVLLALGNAMGANLEYLDDPQFGGEYTRIRA